MRQDEYKKTALVYDAVASGFLSEPHEAAARLCRESGVRRVLEIGCGTGLLTRRLAVDIPLVVGVEYSFTMLGKALRGKTDLCGRGAAEKITCARERQNTPDLCRRNTADSAAAIGSGGGCFFIRADGAFPPFRSNSFDAIVYSLVLHESFAGGETLLEQGFRIAPSAVVLDWRMPERNLDYLCSGWVPVIERLAGREHYRRFRRWSRAGGLYGLAHRVGAQVRQVVSLRGGSLVLAVLTR